MPKKLLQAIFFDIDDTLCATSQFALEARQNAIQSMIDLGLKMTVPSLREVLNNVIEEFSSNYPHHFDQVLERIPPETYKKINPAILVAAAVSAYHKTKFDRLRSFPDVIPFLEKIQHTCLIKGVISEGLAVKQAEKLLLLGIYKYFHPQGIFISEQVGISKINPEMYQFVCKKMNIIPDQTMFVGDHPEKDIDSSNLMNLISVRIHRNGKYDKMIGKTEPDYMITNLDELWTILESDYELSFV